MVPFIIILIGMYHVSWFGGVGEELMFPFLNNPENLDISDGLEGKYKIKSSFV